MVRRVLDLRVQALGRTDWWVSHDGGDNGAVSSLKEKGSEASFLTSCTWCKTCLLRANKWVSPWVVRRTARGVGSDLGINWVAFQLRIFQAIYTVAV